MSENTSLRIIFAGTPEFAARHLAALLASRHEVVCVYTQPDRPAGRGKKLTASPVKALAAMTGKPVLQPPTLKTAEAQSLMAEWRADLMVVVAYGLLLPQAVLDIPRLGCINVHASLLPRWRGAAPIQRAIEAGDDQTGVTIMQMDAGLDTGAMLSRSHCAIYPTDRASDLHDRLLHLGPPALLATLNQMARGAIDATPQDDAEATYAAKLSKDEAHIDWSQPADVLDRRIRAFNPFPVAWTSLEEERLRLLNSRVVTDTHSDTPGALLTRDDRLLVACGDGSVVELLELQLPGGRALSAREAINGFGHRFAPGRQLGL